MARYEHLPIYKAALDVAVGFEKLVVGFSRYHKYTLGSELRNGRRRVLEQVVRANAARERLPGCQGVFLFASYKWLSGGNTPRGKRKDPTPTRARPPPVRPPTRVTSTHARRDAPDAVVMSFATFNSLVETVQLLKSPANAAHLARSIEQYRQGKVKARDLVDA
jgi:hypothetical protein